MSYPITVKPKKVIGGDYVVLASVQFKKKEPLEPVDLSEWINWRAHWRPTRESSEFLVLEVFTDRLNEGYITVVASEELTSEMKRAGVWDVEAELEGHPRTWLYGETGWSKGVTRDD